MPKYEEIKLLEKQPSPEEYNTLRKSVGWHTIEASRIEQSLSKSLFSICAMRGNQIIGFARIVGDGAMYFYVQDVIVLPDYQKLGVGHQLMRNIMEYIDKKAPKKSGAFVGLMVAPGISKFYASYGFHFLPDNSPFMCSWRNGH